MQLSWYEKNVDEENYLLFSHRYVTQGWRSVSPYPCFHNSVEFIVGLSGCSEISVNGTVYPLREGEICYIDKFDRHKSMYQNGTDCYIVLISPSFFTPLNEFGKISFPTFMERNEHFPRLKEYLDFYHQQWDPNSLLMKTAFTDGLAWIMKSYYPTIERQPIDRHSDAMLTAIKYICEHITEDITVDLLARKMGYSPNYFSTVFNDFTGMSFRDYLNACRIIEYNKLKKASPDTPVGTTARLCGFSSPNTFYRAYKKYSLLND